MLFPVACYYFFTERTLRENDQESERERERFVRDSHRCKSKQQMNDWRQGPKYRPGRVRVGVVVDVGADSANAKEFISCATTCAVEGCLDARPFSTFSSTIVRKSSISEKSRRRIVCSAVISYWQFELWPVEYEHIQIFNILYMYGKPYPKVCQIIKEKTNQNRATE